MREKPDYKYYAVSREGKPISYMHCEAGIDPKIEAEKSGPITGITEITASEAAEINNSHATPETSAPVGFVTREEMDATVRKALADFAATLAKATGG
jgi:hypothetical protein